uniref:Uncharacterized protein n=1 Tax=Erpetoichthys calabaricus TaxID=27687 RepID=A0A8C4TG45_ERPCA
MVVIVIAPSWVRRSNTRLGITADLFTTAGDTQLCPFYLVIDKPNKCCSDMWTKYKENCYYFSINKTTWERSSQQCVSHGSQIAVAEDEEVLVSHSSQCESAQTCCEGLLGTSGRAPCQK